MKYIPYDYKMWDAWFMNANGRVHAFHLKKQSGEWNIGHAVTDDLLHFTKCEDILKPLPEETHPDDCLGKFTGCAWYESNEKKAYVYYTMRARDGSEKTGLATSVDLVSFPEYEGNPVLEIDRNIFVEKSALNGHTDCRDFVVVYDEKTKLYYGYFAAMAELDGCLKGVIGVAVSDDLVNWRDQSIAYAPRFNGVIEVPDVFFMDGRWYLTMLTGTFYGAKGAVDDPDLVKFTLYASSESPRGPFLEDADNIFLCGGRLSGYTCRSVELEGKRYLFYVEDNETNGAICLPKEIKVVDGKLRPCYTDILKKIRKRALAEKPRSDDFEVCRTSYAWQTVGGEMYDEEGRLVIRTNGVSYPQFVCSKMKAGSIEAEAAVAADCRECGFVIQTFDEKGAGKERYYFSLDFEFSQLSVYEDQKPNFTVFKPLSKRRYAFEKGKEYHVRVIALEGQFEIYIDGVLALQGGMRTNGSMQAGLFCGDGSARISELRCFELE